MLLSVQSLYFPFLFMPMTSSWPQNTSFPYHFLPLSTSPSFTLSLHFPFIQLLSTVLFVGSMISLYSSSYMLETSHQHRLSTITLIFSCSMITLGYSGSFLQILLGWDGLGVTSYFLILHYLSPFSSSSAKVTLYSNRLGDSLLMFFLFSSFIHPTMFFSTPSPYPLHSMDSLLLLFTSLTKSSQFPFSPWLPEAMSAPTPISSLVHSSTLVTAGYFLLLKSSSTFTSLMAFSLAILSGTTLTLSSLCSLFLLDLKKLVAFSTMSQISLLMLSLSLGAMSSSMLHMISHALFKSSLFMLVGSTLHSGLGSQDSRYLPLTNPSSFSQPFYIIPLLNLLGMFSMSGWLSKDAILLHSFTFTNTPFCIVLGLAVLGTFSYTYRVWWHMSKPIPQMLPYPSTQDSPLVYPTIFILLPSITIGALLSPTLSLPTYPHSSSFFLCLMTLSLLIISMSPRVFPHTHFPPQHLSTTMQLLTSSPSPQMGLTIVTISWSSNILTPTRSLIYTVNNGFIEYLSSSLPFYLARTASTMSLSTINSFYSMSWWSTLCLMSMNMFLYF